jgi:hypothetical protein
MRELSLVERLTRQAAPAKMVDEDDRRADFDQLA